MREQFCVPGGTVAGSVTVTLTLSDWNGCRVTSGCSQTASPPFWVQSHGVVPLFSVAPAGSWSTSVGLPVQAPGPRLVNQRSKRQSAPAVQAPPAMIFCVSRSGIGGGATRIGMHSRSLPGFGSPTGATTVAQFCMPGARLAGMRTVSVTARNSFG